MLTPPAMSTRRERERQEMRQLIIDTARRLFVAEGYESVTIRRIAEAIEYTPGAIYSYFDDKDAILYAIHVQGFEELARVLGGVFASPGTPADYLRNLGSAYVGFARANPELYDLMFVAQATSRGLEDPNSWPEGTRAYEALRTVVRLALDGGWLPAGDPEAVAFGLWSLCHGMVTLQFRDRCIVIPEGSRDTCVEDAFQYMMSALLRPPATAVNNSEVPKSEPAVAGESPAKKPARRAAREA